MKSLNITTLITTLVAIAGYILTLYGIQAGTIMLSAGVITSVGLFLINAFIYISNKHLSSGACMYCVLLLYLFIMFKIQHYEGSIPLFYSGISFFVFAVIAKTITVRRARKQNVVMSRFDFPMIYAVVTTVLSAVVYAI